MNTETTIPYGAELDHDKVETLYNDTEMQGFRFGSSVSQLPKDWQVGDIVNGIVQSYIIARPFEGQTQGKVYCIVLDTKTKLRLRVGVTIGEYREMKKDVLVTLKVADFKPTEPTKNNPKMNNVPFLTVEKIGVHNVNNAAGAVKKETKAKTPPKKTTKKN